MTDIALDKRRKLSSAERLALAHRYWTREDTGETVDSIASAFGIHRVHATNVARKIGREAAMAKEEAPPVPAEGQ